MGQIRIGIVEDEVIIADDIQMLIKELGYECIKPCGKYDKAITMLQTEQPDLVIIDINLGDKKDGIDVAKYIRSKMNIPFIFLTANSDEATVEKAKVTKPNAYIVKPFEKSDLYTAIEIALYNYNDRREPIPEKEKKFLKNALFIKDGDYFHKVHFDDILYLSTEHVYVVVHTKQKNFLVRGNLLEFVESFDSSQFIRVHRCYVANLEKIEKINSSNIIVGGDEIPISKNYRDNLLNMLNIR